MSHNGEKKNILGIYEKKSFDVWKKNPFDIDKTRRNMLSVIDSLNGLVLFNMKKKDRRENVEWD